MDKKQKKTRKSFNILGYFTLYTLIAIIIVTALLTFLFLKHQERTMIQYSIASGEQAAYHLYQRIPKKAIFKSIERGGYIDTTKDRIFYEQLDTVINDFLADYEDVVKVTIFADSGLTLYSTDKDNIGVYDTSPALQQALKGNMGSAFTSPIKSLIGFSTEEEKLYDMNLLEVYLPIKEGMGTKRSGGYQRIIGAFKVYKDMSPFYSVVYQQIYKIFFISAVSMILLFLFLQIFISKTRNVIKKKYSDFDKQNRKLEEAYKRISTSINEVVKHESFDIRFSSDKLLKCWEFKNCKKTDCPSYKSEHLRCWQIAGTFCGGKAQGYFAQKYGDCRKCDVYQYAFKDPLNKIGESFNNMMTLLENKHIEMRGLNQKLKTLADIDHLMQIGNRRGFNKKVEHIHQLALRYNHYYSLIICDIDNFKKYNDTYGHQEGDNVLVAVANLFKKMLRKTDDVFRIGGEELVVLLPEQNLSKAVVIAENLRAGIEMLGIEHKKNDPQVVTISCGVSSFCPGDRKKISWETIFKKADDLLYLAKQEKKNCVYSAANGRKALSYKK
jgi:diguanylate cyclase (GGDEF)-like protein